MKINFHKFLRLNLFFFQLCGFYPHRIVQTQHLKFNESIIWIVIVVNLTTVTVQTIVVFLNYNVIFNRPILLGKVVDMGKYAFLAVTCLTILIESIVNVNEQRSFWSTAWKLHKNFQKILRPSTEGRQNRIYKRNLLKTYAITVVFICVQIYLAIQRTCLFCTIYTFLVFYAFNRYLQYILYVDIIHQQTENLGCELERIIEISMGVTGKKLNDDELRDLETFLVRKLKMTSSFYVKLYEMSVKVNSAFGWSLIVNLVHSYIQIFVDFFWMFQLVSNGLGQYFLGIFTSCSYRLPYIKPINHIFF